MNASALELPTAGTYGIRLVVQLSLLLSFFLFRAQPFVIYACLAREIRFPAKLAAIVLYGSLCWAAVRQGASLVTLTAAALSTAYFAVGALVTYGLAELYRRERVSSGALFVSCLIIFFAVPAAVVPPMVASTALVLGWDKVLSSYSYCRDTFPERSRPTFRECLFFIAINPTLIYAERGERCGGPRLSRAGLGRIARGLLGLTARCVIVSGLGEDPVGATRHKSLLLAGVGALVAVVILFLTHTSVASIQIGAMRLCGYAIPERYVMPLWWRSPDEFWRRWNVWLGHWIRRYVFVPVALSLRRSFPQIGSEAPQAAATLLSFAVVGALHDGYFYGVALASDGPRLSLTFTFAFAVFGLMVFVHSAMRIKHAGKVRSHASTGVGSGAYDLQRTLGVILFIPYAIAMTWLITRSIVDPRLSPLLAPLFPWLQWAGV